MELLRLSISALLGLIGTAGIFFSMYLAFHEEYPRATYILLQGVYLVASTTYNLNRQSKRLKAEAAELNEKLKGILRGTEQ